MYISASRVSSDDLKASKSYAAFPHRRQSKPPVAATASRLGNTVRRATAQPALLRSEADHRRHRPREAIDRLYRELTTRGIHFRPHCWLAQEWFSPDGIPGIAIPFYLAHRRLMRIERRFMREVGGRQPQLADAHTAARGGPRDRFGVPPAAPAALARGVRSGVAALSGYLPAASGQPPLRAAPRCMVCASASDGGFCRDVCGVAQAEFGLAPRIRRLAGLRQTRVHRRAGRRNRRCQTQGIGPQRASRTLREETSHAAPALRAQTGPLSDAAPLRRRRTVAQGVHHRAARAHGAEGRQRTARTCASRCASNSCAPGAFSEYLVHQVLRLMIERCEAPRICTCAARGASSSRS